MDTKHSYSLFSNLLTHCEKKKINQYWKTDDPEYQFFTHFSYAETRRHGKFLFMFHWTKYYLNLSSLLSNLSSNTEFSWKVSFKFPGRVLWDSIFCRYESPLLNTYSLVHNIISGRYYQLDTVAAQYCIFRFTSFPPLLIILFSSEEAALIYRFVAHKFTCIHELDREFYCKFKLVVAIPNLILTSCLIIIIIIISTSTSS